MMAHSSPQAQLTRMQAEIDRLRHQLSATAEALGDSAASAGRQGMLGLRDAYEQARVYGDVARRQAEEATGKARDQVKARPLSTLAGAFVVGIVLGALLGRR
ncbi:DUF883 family protein [Novispirillum sp. DQ9]|uniref:DUF883 family protein n=1 Tax=Novispirillum sp. DQ9 TaxID=3398612 RepID=UPI003C7C038D